MLKLLTQKDKSLESYQKIVFKDTLLQIKTIDIGSIKYFG